MASVPRSETKTPENYTLSGRTSSLKSYEGVAPASRLRLRRDPAFVLHQSRFVPKHDPTVFHSRELHPEILPSCDLLYFCSDDHFHKQNNLRHAEQQWHLFFPVGFT